MLIATFFLFAQATHAANADMIVEYAPFTLKEGVSAEQLLTESQRLQEHFVNKQKGFIRRDLLHLEGRKWVDIVYWESREDAERTAKASESSSACSAYFSLMEPMDTSDQKNGFAYYQLMARYEK